MTFKSKRNSRNYCQVINSTPEKIFPLLCPVREAEWLDGWDYKMIYSLTGLAELGAVFSTSGKDEHDTIWIITKHDSINYEIEFVRFTTESRTCILNIKVKQKDLSTSYVDITYIFTSISESGNKFIDDYSEEVFLEMVKFWEKSINYFLANNRMLKKI